MPGAAVALLKGVTDDLFHAAHDVARDGNCFYSSVFLCLKQDHRAHAVLFDSCRCLEQAALNLRSHLATQLLAERRLQTWLFDLITVLKSTAKSVSNDFPFIQKAGGVLSLHELDKVTVLKCAEAIRSSSVWASEFEKSVVQDMLQQIGISLLVLEAPSQSTIVDTNVIEEQMYAALKREKTLQCIILIHVDNNHYMYMTLRQDGLIPARVIPVRLMQKYIEGFLLDD